MKPQKPLSRNPHPHSSGRRSKTRDDTSPHYKSDTYLKKQVKPHHTTKAVDRIQFATHYKKAIYLIQKSNSADTLDLRFDYICKAIRQLEFCSEAKPENRHIRMQLHICREQRDEIMRTRKAPATLLPLVLDPAWIK